MDRKSFERRSNKLFIQTGEKTKKWKKPGKVTDANKGGFDSLHTPLSSLYSLSLSPSLSLFMPSLYLSYFLYFSNFTTAHLVLPFYAFKASVTLVVRCPN